MKRKSLVVLILSLIFACGVLSFTACNFERITPDMCMGDASPVHKIVRGGESVSIDTSKSYSVDEIKAFFGDDLNGFNVTEQFTCSYGEGNFVCASCKKTFFLDVTGGDHNYVPTDVALKNDGGATVKLECSYCGDEMATTALTVKATERVANCVYDGGTDVEFTCMANGVITSGNITINITEKDKDKHRYGEVKIDSTKTFFMYELKEIFSEEPDDLYIAGNPMSCAEKGVAFFTCNDCFERILLYVLDDHDYKLDEKASTFDEEDGATLKFVCSRCGERKELKVDCEIEKTEPTCVEEGYAIATVSYTLQGVTVEDLKIKFATYPIDNNAHKFNEKPIDLNKVYRIGELKEIFGDSYDTSNIYGNPMTCVIEGRASFTCDVCEQNWVLHVLDEHHFEIDEQAIVYDEEKGTASVAYLCSVCKAETKTVDAVSYKYEETASNCATEGYRKLTYTYMDGEEEVEVTHVFETFPIAETLHSYNKTTVDSSKSYKEADLIAIFGDEHEDLELNIGTCVTAGKSTFTCEVCQKSVELDTFDDHKFALDKDNSVFEKEKTELKFVCTVCKDDEVSYTEAPVSAVYVDTPSNCTEKGNRKLTLKYKIGETEYNDEFVVKEFDLDYEKHLYNEKTVDPSKTYLVSELKEIFGEELDGLTVIGSGLTCDKDGNAYFVCEGCKQNILFTARDDHKYVLDETKTTYSDKTVSLVYVCSVCKGKQIVSAKITKTETIKATCSATGGKYVTYSYEFGGEKYENIVGTVETYAIDPLNHRYGENAVKYEEQLSYEKAIKVFGEDLEGLNLFKALSDCATPVNASFTCEDCEEPVIITVLGKHNMVVDYKASTITENKKELQIVCSVCKDKTVAYKAIATEYAEDEKKETCIEDGKKFATYKYEYKSETFEGEIILEVIPKTPDLHAYGKYKFKTAEKYSEYELKQKFGAELEGLTIYNDVDYDCKNAGSASFVCDDCGDNIYICIYENHTFVVDEENSKFTKSSATTEITLKCSVCGATETVKAKTVNYKTIPATHSETGKDYVVYSYEVYGVTYNGEHVLKEYEKEDSAYLVNGKVVDIEKVYTMAELQAIFGKDLDGLEPFGNSDDKFAFQSDDGIWLVVSYTK